MFVFIYYNKALFVRNGRTCCLYNTIVLRTYRISYNVNAFQVILIGNPSSLFYFFQSVGVNLKFSLGFILCTNKMIRDSCLYIIFPRLQKLKKLDSFVLITKSTFQKLVSNSKHCGFSWLEYQHVGV